MIFGPGVDHDEISGFHHVNRRRRLRALRDFRRRDRLHLARERRHIDQRRIGETRCTLRLEGRFRDRVDLVVRHPGAARLHGGDDPRAADLNDPVFHCEICRVAPIAKIVEQRRGIPQFHFGPEHLQACRELYSRGRVVRDADVARIVEGNRLLRGQRQHSRHSDDTGFRIRSVNRLIE